MSQPQGLIYYPAVLTPEQHDSIFDQLLRDSKDSSWKKAGRRAHRIVRHYGYNYNYNGKRELSLADPIPDYMTPLIESLRQKPELKDFVPDQAIINRYLVGEGISKHIDDPKLFGDIVVGVTIGAAATMRFRHTDVPYYDQRVQPRSAYMMSGESRYKWTHEMVKSKAQQNTRFSITFRTIRQD